MPDAARIAPARTASRPRPFLLPELCKGCGRCIDACPRHCIAAGEAVDPRTGLVPVELHLEDCNGCGLCLTACPEPFGLRAEVSEPEEVHDFRAGALPEPVADRHLPLAGRQPMAMKGAHAAAIGALAAGCRHFYGYPITPSTEGSELMARLLPRLGGHFVQAVSEVAAVNFLYGAGAAGVPAVTFTSSPGFSLMLEGVSYMIGAEIPAVILDVMRGGPGLGNIAPEQTDIKLACHGLGHGNTRAIVLAPASPQEMLDLTMLAFELAFRYRNPVIVLADGYLGQMTGRVRLPAHVVQPGTPAWAVTGDAAHRRNLVCSIHLSESDLEQHNLRLLGKYERISRFEQRSESYRADDADVLLIACNTPARMAKGAVEELRAGGVGAGLFRPLTLWPFPVDALAPLVGRARRTIVVEAGPGQLADEVRLALARAGHAVPPLGAVWRCGGTLPTTDDIVRHVLATEEVPA
ncbi:MAG: 3-methyl-2-oxobutanoate dehydrogenase subunit VorB [Thermoanaerobaculia bacterium]|nr:MAG: 3-methyl-2-oxobutanoate dehydrogenase subunit VorB [Thermoanaerobaculia bacterium]MBZ0102182.1 3-methyl-2-oxobutanoate dehydrogenase subunit VorB [Thermoanaerobaculia bacterium]